MIPSSDDGRRGVRSGERAQENRDPEGERRRGAGGGARRRRGVFEVEVGIPPRESPGAVVVREEEGGSETRGALEVARRRRIRGGSFAARARERGREEPSVSRVHAEELREEVDQARAGDFARVGGARARAGGASERGRRRRGGLREGEPRGGEEPRGSQPREAPPIRARGDAAGSVE